MKRHLVLVALGIVGLSSSAYAQSNAANSASGGADKAHQDVRFGGFGFDFTLSDSTGLNAVGQNYRNELNFYFEPRWDIGRQYFQGTRFRTFSIGLRFALTQPLAGVDESYFGPDGGLNGPQGSCGNIQPSGNGTVDPNTVGRCNPASNDFRTGYSDIWLTIRNPRIYTIPKLGVNINPSIRMFLPASKESLYQTLRFSLGGSLALSRTFYKDHISLAFAVGYTKNFHQYTTPQLDPERGGSSANSQGGNFYDGIIGAGLSNLYIDPSRTGTLAGQNVSQSVLYTIDGGVNFNDQWSLDALYIIRSAFVYDSSCVVEQSGYYVDTCQTGDAVAAGSGSWVTRPGARDAQILWLTLAYQPTDWVGLALMWINWAPLKKPDGSFRQGIISTDYNAFTTVSLSATFSLDRIANKIWKPALKPVTAQTGNGLIQAKR